ncbi:DegT/DnrJ/EryC1/StrS aminotransferase family protein [Maricurvus nonylphenolicus]|uniref:DegT/DnrJ/EryC1/StrS family aminotransferase n=1 Tax=Maricurvus nonylphenolicus TaxID=1008307 RepID=UPI0036F3F7A2
MLGTSFSPWPCFTQEEADAVQNVLLSNKVNYWTGSECRAFEQEFADFCSTKFAVAVSNGTVALDVALAALGVGEGDEVIVTSRTFLASATSILNAGAKPVFSDVDRNSQNVTAETLKPLITPKTAAIICVHLSGWPCDMDPIMSLAQEHGLAVVEDCAQAHGAKYKGMPVGSIGHIGAWSFCQDKIMTTGGEGGMVTTNVRSLWEKVWAYKDHGKSWDTVYNKSHPEGFRWLHETLGTNGRMTEMQAAIGRIQLSRMPDWHASRTFNAEKLLSAFSDLDAIRVPVFPDGCAHYKLYVFVKPDVLMAGWDRDRLVREIVNEGVPCYQGVCPEIYREKVFVDLKLNPSKRYPVSKELGETSLMFLVHPTLTEAEIEKTIRVVSKVFQAASK